MKNILLAAVAISAQMSLGGAAEPSVDYETLTAQQKEEFLLTQTENTEYATLPAWTGLEPLKLVALAVPFRNKARAEYMGVTVNRRSDFMPKGRGKPVHTYGNVGGIRFVVERDLGYTGLLASGAQYGLARFSLAAKPSATNVAPGLALKFLVDGQPSRNVQVMYSLEGQSSYNVFENTFSNVLKAPSGGPLKLLEPVFSVVSKTPFKLGLAQLAEVDERGEPVTPVVSPDQIRLVPAGELKFDAAPHEVREDLNSIPVGTKLYQVWTVRKEGDKPEYLGYIESTSRFTSSQFGDQNLFFNHQRKEADAQR